LLGLARLIALRRMSTALSGTNLDSHARFLLEGERYRYAFVQRLNGLHVNVVTPTGAGDERIDKHHWEDTPRFGYASAPFAEVAARHAWPAFALLGGWLLALLVIGGWVAKRLERNPA
jgi:ABC-2 type transport system permease protein